MYDIDQKPILNQWSTSIFPENKHRRFSNASRGYRSGTLLENELV